ncbi:transposable element Tcb2 transposase [Hydra vulgaris]|uniref:transposable element Tcb2 transposase n=1 Tax=Hydra vulgaris TaxID=6087 RepID=UPI0032E9E0FD
MILSNYCDDHSGELIRTGKETNRLLRSIQQLQRETVNLLNNEGLANQAINSDATFVNAAGQSKRIDSWNRSNANSFAIDYIKCKFGPDYMTSHIFEPHGKADRQGMPKYRQLTTEERLRAVFLAEKGASLRKIARELKATPMGIKEIIDKHIETGSTADKRRSGRPKKTTPHNDRVLFRSLQDRRLTAPQLGQKLSEEHGVTLATRTVRQRLLKAGLCGCVAAKKPLLSATNVRRQLAFAKAHKDLTVYDCKHVLFSDEKSFKLFLSSKRVIVRRRVGEKFSKNCIAPTVKHGGKSLMIWGCMSGYGFGHLYRCTGSMNQHQYIDILQNTVFPSASALFWQLNSFFFQHDNAPCHKAKTVTDFLRRSQVAVLDWPAQSPDFTPIENLWSVTAKNIEGKRPSNLNSLKLILQDA